MIDIICFLFGSSIVFCFYFYTKDRKKIKELQEKDQEISFLELTVMTKESQIKLREMVAEIHKTECDYWRKEYLKIKKTNQN